MEGPVEGLIHVFEAQVDDFIEKLILSKPDPPVSCIIADSFHVWASTIATKYNLVNVSFWTQPATVLTIYYHTDLLKSKGHLGCHDKCEDTIRYIPGVQAIKPADLPSYCQDPDSSTVMPVLCSSVLKMRRKQNLPSATQCKSYSPQLSQLYERSRHSMQLGRSSLQALPRKQFQQACCQSQITPTGSIANKMVQCYTSHLLVLLI